MKYLVIEQKEITGEDPMDDGEVAKVHLCETSREVHAALLQARRADHDWSVWEIVGSTTKRRSIQFKVDGKITYDVEIL